jgi:hypothetical protein
MTVAFEVEVSLHDACGCTQARTYDEFTRSVRRDHPMVWEWTRDRYPVSSKYIDAREWLGHGPKVNSNPDTVPIARQRTLTSPERREHNRQKARWARFGELIEADRLSLSESALLATVQDGWMRCSRLKDDGRAHETYPANVEYVDGKPVCASGCPAEKC